MAMLLWADIFLEYLHQCCPSSKHLMVSSFAGGSSFCMQFLTTKSYFTIMKNEEQENCRRGIGDLPALPLIPKHQTASAPCQVHFAFLGKIFCVGVVFFISMLSCLCLQCPRISVATVEEQGVIGAVACLGRQLGKQGM